MTLTKALDKKLDGKEKYYRGILCYLFTDIKTAAAELEKDWVKREDIQKDLRERAKSRKRFKKEGWRKG